MDEKHREITASISAAKAKNDANNIYHDLSLYEVSIVPDENNNWKIDYILKDKNALGVGPHYIISKTTSEILYRRYEQ